MRRTLLFLAALILVLGATALAQYPNPVTWLTLAGVRWQQHKTDVAVSGWLVSRAPRVVWDVRLAFTAYDKDNYPVAHGGAYFRSIGPGEELPFEAHAGSLSPVSRVDVFVRSAEQDPP